MSVMMVGNPIKINRILINSAKYLADVGNTKSLLRSGVLPVNERLAAFGLSLDPEIAAKEIIMWHDCYGKRGENIAYKILFDMESGVCTPWQIGEVAWEINHFLRILNIPFIQGIHCNTKREHDHPHVHILMSAVYPLTGKKVNLNHAFIIGYKSYANMVLFKHGLPLIKLGIKSLPFKIVVSEVSENA